MSVCLPSSAPARRLRALGGPPGPTFWGPFLGPRFGTQNGPWNTRENRWKRWKTDEGEGFDHFECGWFDFTSNLSHSKWWAFRCWKIGDIGVRVDVSRRVILHFSKTSLLESSSQIWSDSARIDMLVTIWLVVYLPLWKIWKSVGMIIPNIQKNEKWSKPPTRMMFDPEPHTKRIKP